MATLGKTFARPKGITSQLEDNKIFAESRTPLDRTCAPSSQIVPPGTHKRITTPVDPNAFSAGKCTSKKDPRKFLLGHTGVGGNNTPVTASRMKKPDIDGACSSPPKAGAFEKRDNPPNTELRRFYERGDLPCVIDQGGVHNKLAWKIEIPQLDFHKYLPIFFDGLREKEHPYKFVAREGIMDLLTYGGNKILPCIPQLIIPIKQALNTRDPEIVSFTCQVLKKLVLADVNLPQGGLIGQAIVPYYRQIMPVLNLFFNKNKNTGDEFDYGQRKQGIETLGEVIQDTLNTFERFGGDDAYVNIKYLVPCYESCFSTNA